MKILYVTSNNEDFGGADLCLFRLVCEVRDAGHDVSVLMRTRNRLARSYAAEKIPLIEHAFYRPTKRGGVASLLHGAGQAIASLFWLMWFIRRERPAIVHVNDLIDVLPALAARLCGCRVVYHVRMIRGGTFQRRVLSSYIQWIANVSLCVSGAVQDAYWLPRTTSGHLSRVLHDWADPDLLTRGRGACPSEFAGIRHRVVMIGRVTQWKGQATFVAAVRAVRQRLPMPVGFFIVGAKSSDLADQQQVTALLADAGAAGIQWLGERSDVPSLLGWADISVHASLAPDPFPNVVLESLLIGVATIGADSGGVPEMIKHGSTGMLIEPGNAEQLADALYQLLSDDALRARLGAAGRDHVTRLCDRNTIVAALLSCYASLGLQAPAHRTSDQTEASR